MTEFDDDLLLQGAFRDLDQAAEPHLRIAEVAAVRGSARRKRRNSFAMVGGLAALVIATPVVAFATFDRGQPPAPPLASPSPTVVTVAVIDTAIFAKISHGVAVDVFSYTDGKATQLISFADPTGDIASSITVSPDGTRLAWAAEGSLRISNLDGTQPISALKDVSPVGQSAPVWAPDSKSLYTNRGKIAATGGGTTPFGPYLNLTWSPDGRHFAHAYFRRAMVRDASGALVHQAEFECFQCDGLSNATLAVSPGGRYVALGAWPTDSSRQAYWDQVYDMETGVSVRMSLPSLTSGRFLADGTILLATPGTLVRRTVAGEVIAAQPLPIELHGAILLHAR